MKSSRTGFTLIELLVVIAIIAILAAILFPVFAQAKLQAKKIASLSNAKELALGELMYQNDNDDHLIKEYFGFPSDCASWGNTYYNWRYAMNPYLKNTQIMQDPTDEFNTPTYFQPAYTDGNNNDQINISSNYAVNNNIIGFANGACAGAYTPPGLDTSDQLDNPAGTIIMMPSRSHWNDLKMDYISQTWEPPSTDPTNTWCAVNTADTSASCPPTGDGPINSVLNSAAFVWVDGHAKSRAPVQTLETQDPVNDDWASKYAICPQTGVTWTQANRINIASTKFPEY